MVGSSGEAGASRRGLLHLVPIFGGGLGSLFCLISVMVERREVVVVILAWHLGPS